ncbi:unnamed protein product [Rotaria magnacalcarata]|uniref:Uncharacterized protein n=2 Tax=Rotaria magnacalcarata TaxID=392030 RepID=A0A816DTV2_9BILA|nr:unnamed protein product [Rotaria magnacalcarata]
MPSLKNFKEKYLKLAVAKPQLTSNESRSSLTSSCDVLLDRNKVNLLAKWLDHLNQQRLITITEQNDIVIMAGGENDQAQQIFINHDDVNAYLETKANKSNKINEYEILKMPDIASVLLIYKYVNDSSGQLVFSTQTIPSDGHELTWLQSIVHSVQPDPQSRETYVKLFDGDSMQSLSIPWEYMAPTDDLRAVANYLFQNGHVRYDIDTGVYAYRYVEPDILLDKKADSPERTAKHQMLSFHISRIHVDEKRERIELEFLNKVNQRLTVPSSWYRQISAHHFDRYYIIDALLANGGIISGDNFLFMDHVYSLKVPGATTTMAHSTVASNLKTVNLSSKQKSDLVCRYIDLIIEQDGVKHDNYNDIFLLENANDGSQLYFTQKHSQWIRQNRFQRLDVIYILAAYGQIKEDKSGNWLLYYNDHFIQLPFSIIRSFKIASQNVGYSTHSLNEQYLRDIQPISQTTRIRTTTPPINNRNAQFGAYLPSETQANFLKRHHNTIDYMYRHNLITWDKRLKLIKLHFSDQTLILPIDHLHSILDPRVMSSSSSSSSTVDDVLPFTSRQLSQYLINNSHMINNFA